MWLLPFQLQLSCSSHSKDDKMSLEMTSSRPATSRSHCSNVIFLATMWSRKFFAKAIASPFVYVAEGFVNLPWILTWVWSLLHFLLNGSIFMLMDMKQNFFSWGLPKAQLAKWTSFAPKRIILLQWGSHLILERKGCSIAPKAPVRFATCSSKMHRKARVLPSNTLWIRQVIAHRHLVRSQSWKSSRGIGRTRWSHKEGQ